MLGEYLSDQHAAPREPLRNMFQSASDSSSRLQKQCLLISEQAFDSLCSLVIKILARVACAHGLVVLDLDDRGFGGEEEAGD